MIIILQVEELSRGKRERFPEETAPELPVQHPLANTGFREVLKGPGNPRHCFKGDLSPEFQLLGRRTEPPGI